MQESLSSAIKADDIDEVYLAITHLAAEWAVAGFTTKSNELLQTLWSFQLPHSDNLKNIDRDFQIFWDEVRQYPDNIPFTLYSLSDKKDKLTDLFHPLQLRSVLHERVRNTHWKELSGEDLWSKSLLLTYDPTADNYYSSQKNQLEAIAAMEKYVVGSPHGSSSFDSLIVIIVLSLRNKLIDKAKHYLNEWGKLYVKNRNILHLCALLRQRRVTKLLLSQQLAPLFALKDYNFDTGILEIKQALTERINNGRTLIYGHLSWKELLQQISTIAIENEDDLFDDIVKQSRWLGTDAATLKEIKEAEKRLNIKLPKEYKEFLLTTNGFAASNCVDITMAPVQKIDWLQNVDDSYLNWYDTISDDEEYQQLSKKLKSALYIGGFGEEQHALLIPNTMNKDWECWSFAFWRPGEAIYTNLRFYFEDTLQFLQQDK